VPKKACATVKGVLDSSSSSSSSSSDEESDCFCKVDFLEGGSKEGDRKRKSNSGPFSLEDFEGDDHTLTKSTEKKLKQLKAFNEKRDAKRKKEEERNILQRNSGKYREEEIHLVIEESLRKSTFGER